MHLFDQKLTYVSVPKCACSTLKHFMFEVQNGFAFRNFRVGAKRYTVHALSRSIPFAKLAHDKIGDHFKFALVRAPVSRVKSCYESKVLGGEMRKQKGAARRLQQAGLPLEPSFREFVEQLDGYRKLSPVVRNHSMPLSRFLGRDPAWFDRIYRLSEIEELAATVRERSGSDAKLRHRNPSKRKIDPAELTPELVAEIDDAFREDHELFSRWFDPVSSPSKVAVAV
ncbi:sulfotransferase family 2 domain-containing protein [uncultured Jannaschia sp.]|uniref:sulfotransferase family 2 domain-containing protein n=1 Tax=uncultured Jannaschia sp. TaxID=293347 RepID=UPI00261C54E1|nr:sulfotransferase family 2 domain-containing protein [uncultured Jannaschia sp.]